MREAGPLTKLESAVCEKCGSTDIQWRWHKVGWSQSRPGKPGCMYGDHAHPSGEHLHAYCQRCKFDWFTEVIADA